MTLDNHLHQDLTGLEALSSQEEQTQDVPPTDLLFSESRAADNVPESTDYNPNTEDTLPDKAGFHLTRSKGIIAGVALAGVLGAGAAVALSGSGEQKNLASSDKTTTRSIDATTTEVPVAQQASPTDFAPSSNTPLGSGEHNLTNPAIIQPIGSSPEEYMAQINQNQNAAFNKNDVTLLDGAFTADDTETRTFWQEQAQEFADWKNKFSDPTRTSNVVDTYVETVSSSPEEDVIIVKETLIDKGMTVSGGKDGHTNITDNGSFKLTIRKQPVEGKPGVYTHLIAASQKI